MGNGENQQVIGNSLFSTGADTFRPPVHNHTFLANGGDFQFIFVPVAIVQFFGDAACFGGNNRFPVICKKGFQLFLSKRIKRADLLDDGNQPFILSQWPQPKTVALTTEGTLAKACINASNHLIQFTHMLPQIVE